MSTTLQILLCSTYHTTAGLWHRKRPFLGTFFFRTNLANIDIFIKCEIWFNHEWISIAAGADDCARQTTPKGCRHQSHSNQTMIMTLIHSTSIWTHWATFRRYSCLSRAPTSASSQVSPILCRSFLTTPLQFALGRPGPLEAWNLPSACCGMRWWSILIIWPCQRSLL